MKPAVTALVARLETSRRVAPGSIVTGTDKVLSIGQDVVRLVHDGRIATAVASDAPLGTTCGAVLDAIALLETRLHAGVGEVDSTGVDVLIDRPIPSDDQPTEADQAVRSVAAAAHDLDVRVWYTDLAGEWVNDQGLPPTWAAGRERVSHWVTSLLLPRLTAEPSGLTLALVRAVDDPSLHVYPSLVKASNTDQWSLRIDGLQIGVSSSSSASLEIGKPGQLEDGPQRRAFIEVFGGPHVTVGIAPADDELSVADAADLVRTLMLRFRSANILGAPITHRMNAGVRIVDEHALESRLLKRIVPLRGDQAAELVRDDTTVARGSQFPTLWGHGARPRYLDALVRDDRTPIAVELKVATGGQGRYYRRALAQAALYRHFILNAADLDPWFAQAELDRSATCAVVGIPTPTRWTERFKRDLDLLRRTGGRLGIEVLVLDDRRTPPRIADPGRADPSPGERERRSWALVAELCRNWNDTFGQVIEFQGGGGQYDHLQLRAKADRTFSYPSPRPRIDLNRNGSARVRSHLGHESWVWRGIWSELNSPDDVQRAAHDLATVAGLGPAQPTTTPTFAELAASVLHELTDRRWRWRSAWRDSEGEVAGWLEPFRSTLPAYLGPVADDHLPTVARLWGLVSGDGEAIAVVDQETLKMWGRRGSNITVLADEESLVRHASPIRTDG